MQYGTMPSIIIPITFIIGTIFTLIPTILGPEFFSRSNHYWVIFSIIAISTPLSVFIFFIIFMPDIKFILFSLIFVILGTIECLFVFKNLKKEEKVGTKEHSDLMGIFSRPKKITEEEVSVSKEKKICLVCKGKVARSNIFLCPECDTFYCSKCSEALSNVENACWVCETPFDESKPVSLPEKKEEEVVVEDVDQKKIKKK